MFEYLKIKEVYPNWIEKGFFSSIVSPIWENDFDSNDLDIMFFTEYGNSLISPFIEYFLNEEYKLNDNAIDKISKIIYSKYRAQWEKLYKILTLEYNPIENYNRIETENIQENKSHNINNTKNSSIKDIGENESNFKNNSSLTIDSNSNDTNNIKSREESKDNIYGYNSSNEKPSSLRIDNNEGENITKRINNSQQTGINTNNVLENRTNDRTMSDEMNTEENENNETERSSKISGNIGVTTSQQMIQSEIELWRWNFIETIFKDVKKEMALSIY